MFTILTLAVNEYIPQRSGMNSKPLVADLFDMQTNLTSEVEEIIAYLAQKDAEVAILKVALLKAQEEGLGGNEGLCAKK